MKYFVLVEILLIILCSSCKKAIEKKPITVPIVTTSDVTAISQYSAYCGATVIDNGGDNQPLLVGVCWSKEEIPIDFNPSVYNFAVSSCSSIPCNFICEIGKDPRGPIQTHLSANTTYYVRAYSGNWAGLGYGNMVTFKTLSESIVVPQTKPVTNIVQTTAVCGGIIDSGLDTTVTMKGVCWSTSQNPSILDNKTNDGSGAGDFVSLISGLTPNTTYYLRAYTTNKGGTGYGTELSFVTLPITVPGIMTSAVTYITKTSAICGGSITSEGLVNAKEKGVCWSTTQNPTISDNRTSDGTGPGDFVSKLTGLTPFTKYFIRSYATYNGGTFYGAEINFTTNSTVVDINGNVYNTVTIGTQEWMSENLRSKNYQDLTPIPLLSYTGIGSGPTTDGYYLSQNDTSYVNKYGYLYNHLAVLNKHGLCPTGWHVPSDGEWKILTNYLGGSKLAGGKLKEARVLHWAGPNTGATNESSFTALPGGLWSSYFSGNLDHPTYYISISEIGNYGNWWANNVGLRISISYRSSEALFSQDPFLNDIDFESHKGFSVRCIKNE